MEHLDRDQLERLFRTSLSVLIMNLIQSEDQHAVQYARDLIRTMLDEKYDTLEEMLKHWLGQCLVDPKLKPLVDLLADIIEKESGMSEGKS